MKSEWKECILGDLGDVVGGATPSTKVSANYENGGISWITPKDLAAFSGRYIARGERNITEQGLKSCSAQLMPQHSVLFSSRAPIGYVAIADRELCTNQGFKSIVPNANVDYLFLYYLLTFHKDAIENLGSGTTFKEVSAKVMRGVKVKVPSLPTQRKIAAVLSSLDDKIETNNAICRNLETVGGFMLQHYLEQCNAHVKLSSLMGVENGYAFKSKEYSATGTYKVVTIKNVLDGRVDAMEASGMDEIPADMRPGCRLAAGDVLVSLTGNVGRVGIVTQDKLLLNQRVAKIVPKKKSLLPFLYFYFRNETFKARLEALARGTAQPNLSTTETLALEITADEKGAETLSSSLTPLIWQIITRFQENERLSTLRDTLLPRLMSGEIDVDKVQL